MKPACFILTALILAASPALAQVQKAESAELLETPDPVNPLAVLADPQAAQQDTTRPPADFVEVDKEPTIVSKKEPVYPEAAKKAGMEGKVWAKMWIDKQGMPRNVQILKSDNDVFNKAVLDAAYGFRFTPAMIKDKPVDVWVSVPFMFKLADKPDKSGDQSYNDLTEFVKDVLNGKSIDSTRIRTAVNPNAYAVIGGEYIFLLDALRRQVSGDKIIEPANRKIQYTAYLLDEKRDSSYMTIKTEGKGKSGKVRYHTILSFRSEKGDWTIRGWHASQ